MGILWYIISAVIVIFLQRFLFRYYGMRKVSYSRSFNVQTCFEGDAIEMVEKLSNGKLLPVPWLRVESLLNAGLKFESDANFAVSNGELFQNHRSLFSLMGNKQLTRRHVVHAAQRGCYRITGASLTFGDLFGLFSTWKSIPLEVELLVYPLPADRSLIQLPSRSWQGDIAVRRWIVEDPFAISGVREYRPGDPLKMINWNATARTGNMQVHRRDYTADFRLIVALNVEDHAGMWHNVTDTSVIEQGIRLAAGIMQLATEQGLETAFVCNGHDMDKPGEVMVTERGGGHEHLNYVFGQMSKLVIARTLPFHTMLEQLSPEWGERSDVVVISAFISEDIEEMMGQLRRDGHAVDWLPIAEKEAEAV
ncbi:DUF58 domain-containing protein [Paenibacillus rhizovicinus]|uniref:DUF58 domain-containing protein n=1 Tax=Paenibacillus rhizovicinus TaxID=2704463 RepID=A0A6C0P7F2_9BACL|nr:DUF58 domain-containing protein [Paenibacillus rhizovicinus]QHW34560.1 DUF58 domain-containing protein [Paenibacillus rhizovicinus]